MNPNYYYQCGELGYLPIARQTYSGYYYVKNLLHTFAKLCKTRIGQDMSTNCMFEGRVGSGKSNSAINLARHLQKDWDVKENYIYSVDDLWNEAEKRNNKNRVFLIDEASTILSKKNTMTRDSKNILGLLDTSRILHWTLIFCCPSAENINTEFMQNHLNYMFSAPKVPPFPELDNSIRGYFIYKEKDVNNNFVPIVGGGCGAVDPRIWNKYIGIKMEANLEYRRKFRKNKENTNNDKKDNKYDGWSVISD